MTVVNNPKELERYLNKQIQQSLKSDVAPKIVKIAQNRTQKDVYDVYPNPVEYQRSGQLKESFKVNSVQDGIEIENTRTENGRDIPEIIEYGHDRSKQGYEYPAYYRGGSNFIQPRPFIENTRKQILDENIHVNELKNSLRKQGFDVTKL